MTPGAGDARVTGESAAGTPVVSAWLGLAALSVGAILGHVAWLLLLSPDPWVLGFGDLRALAPGRVRLAALLVAGQVLALVLCLRSVRTSWSSAGLPAIPKGWIALALAMQVLAATAVTSQPADYPLHAALTGLLLTLAWVTLAAAAAHAGPLGLDRFLDRVLDSGGTRWWCAVGAAVATLGISRVVLDGIPHIPDEVVYLLQASYLSQGVLYLTGLPAGAVDAISTATHEGRWFGIFPVGWPAILAVGVRAGAPWLVNPLLTGGAILSAHALVRQVWGLRVANLTAFFASTSPWLLFLGASYMAHTASILFAVLAIRGALAVAGHARTAGWPLAGGCALGVLVLIRPFEGVLVGLLCAGIVLVGRGRGFLTVGAVAFALTALSIGGLTLPYNRVLTGRALVDPITLYFDEVHYPGANRLGFGADVGNVGWGNDALPGHGPLEAAINASWNASLVQIELFGWAFGSLAVVLLALGAGRRAFDRSMAPALATVGVVVGAYTLYWYSAADFGARYWSQTILPLSLLTAAALIRLPDAAALRRMAVLATLLGAPVVLAMRGAIKYRDYRGMTRDLEHLAESEGFGRDLILIRGDVFSDYSQGLMLNAPDLDGPGPLYFRWVDGTELSALQERFPGRRLWVVDGPSRTGGQPRVVSGPTS